MKKALTLLLTAALFLGLLPGAVFAGSLGQAPESRLTGEFRGDNFHATTWINYFIGETENKLTFKLDDYGFSGIPDGSSYTFSVALLPDENTLLDYCYEFTLLPDTGREFYFISGTAFKVDNGASQFVAVSPMFLWGEPELNSDGVWEYAPIERGRDNITLALGQYPETVIDDGRGHIFDGFRAELGTPMAYSMPTDPKGIPYLKYFELGDGETRYSQCWSSLVLTPKIADEILETGGHFENGFFYPILEYFPEVRQMILDARAAASAAAASPDSWPTVTRPVAPTRTAAASPTAAAVIVDGRTVAFDAYNIGGNNYFKLRDLAYVLSGTPKQFEVGWDSANNAISLTSGQAYTSAGGEMASGGSTNKTARETTSRIFLDGKEVSFTAYNIDNNNYFMLRDVGRAFNFSVQWDGSRNSIVIDTSEGYSESAVQSPMMPAPPAAAPPPASSLPISQSLRRGMTESEFNQAYAIAGEIAMRYAGLSRAEQLQGIYTELRFLSETEVAYSMTAQHYNDVYGFFVLQVASCAGATRAVGLCLTILGIPYEHVNENQLSHQWCRVEVNGVYWLCDAFGMYVGPEPAPYKHPYVETP